jgi:hypothetical protein
MKADDLEKAEQLIKRLRRIRVAREALRHGAAGWNMSGQTATVKFGLGHEFKGHRNMEFEVGGERVSKALEDEAAILVEALEALGVEP